MDSSFTKGFKSCLGAICALLLVWFAFLLALFLFRACA